MRPCICKQKKEKSETIINQVIHKIQIFITFFFFMSILVCMVIQTIFSMDSQFIYIDAIDLDIQFMQLICTTPNFMAFVVSSLEKFICGI